MTVDRTARPAALMRRLIDAGMDAAAAERATAQAGVELFAVDADVAAIARDILNQNGGSMSETGEKGSGLSIAEIANAVEALKARGIAPEWAVEMVDRRPELFVGKDPATIAGFMVMDAPDEFFVGGKRPERTSGASEAALPTSYAEKAIEQNRAAARRPNVLTRRGGA